jgi:ADP-ribose pyrophosphatase YjhB (NUDIX family)
MGKVLLRRFDCGEGCDADMGEKQAQGARRQRREEAGMEGSVQPVLSLVEARLWQNGQRRHMMDSVFMVERVSGTLRPKGKSTAQGFLPRDGSADPLARPLRLAASAPGEAARTGAGGFPRSMRPGAAAKEPRIGVTIGRA